MATPGQPTLYKPEYVELAHDYCLPGATPRSGPLALPARIVCCGGFEKALLPVTVISDPGNGTQKFVLLRAEPTGLECCRRKHAPHRDHWRKLRKSVAAGLGVEQRLWPPVEAPPAFRVAAATRHS